MEQLKSRIEAVLFVTAKVLQIKDIAEILEEEPEKVEEALLELIMDYASRDGALEIDDENGYILQVKQEHLDIVEKLCPVELKPPVLKTLTVIALKEPIRQSLLKDLRGSNAYEHVQELLEKGLISRHKDKNGRSYNIKTTPKFAEYFKLKGDVRALVKTLNIDKGVKDNEEDTRHAGAPIEKSVRNNEEITHSASAPIEKSVRDNEEITHSASAPIEKSVRNNEEITRIANVSEEQTDGLNE